MSHQVSVKHFKVARIGGGLILAVFLATGFFFPLPGQARHEVEPTYLVVTLTDSGRRVALSSDKVLSVELSGSMSTGYSWALLEQDGDLQALPPAYRTDTSLIGGSETSLFRFTARQAGASKLTFIYRRPWQAHQPPLRVFTLTVEAAGAYRGPTPPEQAKTQAVPPARAFFDLNTWLDIWRVNASAALPAKFNWCANGGCTSIKDQGQCQSCWAFATVGVLEQAIALNDGLKKDLSEYYLIACNESGYSCIGGKFAHEYHWNVIPQGELAAGARYEADYPYNELVLNPRCQNQPHPAHETIAGWAYVDDSVLVPSVEKLKQALYNHGPLAVAVCTGPAFLDYSGGVFSTDESEVCPNSSGSFTQIGVNHALLLVGWDDSQGAWILRNEWGPGWGEDGYMRIKYGASNVGAKATYILYPGWPPEPTPVVTEPPATASASPSTTPATPSPSGTPAPKQNIYLPAVRNGE